jgi:hypothetical protein
MGTACNGGKKLPHGAGMRFWRDRVSREMGGVRGSPRPLSIPGIDVPWSPDTAPPRPDPRMEGVVFLTAETAQSDRGMSSVNGWSSVCLDGGYARFIVSRNSRFVRTLPRRVVRSIIASTGFMSTSTRRSL